MLEEIEIVESVALDAAVIHLNIPREQIQEVMEPSIHEIVGALDAQSIAITGPMFAHHLSLSDSHFDFEVGFPTASLPVAAGRMKPGRTPSGKAAKATYVGPYEGLFEAWATFGQRLEGSKLEVRRGSLWEVYSLGPETDPDPTNWRTDLYQPMG